MTADKRTPHTDALDTLGMIIGPDEKRDAIHLGVEPVTAGEYLRAGDHVGLKDGFAVKAARDYGLGIVDPFLSVDVKPGERFWLVVYPRQITSLRHVWEHPSFPASGETMPPVYSEREKVESEAWLRDFIERSDCPGYETVIAAALDNRDTWDDEHLHFRGRDAHGEIPPEFWEHLEVVTGRAIAQDKRAKYFSCSC